MYAAVSAACKQSQNSIVKHLVISTYQVVEFDGGDTLVDTRDDLLGDSSSVDMLRVESITEPRHTSGNLVELHAFFASVCGSTCR